MPAAPRFVSAFLSAQPLFSRACPPASYPVHNALRALAKCSRLETWHAFPPLLALPCLDLTNRRVSSLVPHSQNKQKRLRGFVYAGTNCGQHKSSAFGHRSSRAQGGGNYSSGSSVALPVVYASLSARHRTR